MRLTRRPLRHAACNACSTKAARACRAPSLQQCECKRQRIREAAVAGQGRHRAGRAPAVAVGSIADAIEHNAALLQSGPSRAPRRAWWGNRYGLKPCAPFGFAERGVMSGAPRPRQRSHYVAALKSQSACSWLAPPARRFKSRANALGGATSPRPPRPVSQERVAPRAASLLSALVCLAFPSAPAKRGAP